MPVLVLDDGTSLYDSRVIVGYLDTVSPVSRLIPEPSRAEAHLRMASILELKKDGRGAISHYREALRIHPDLPET